LIQVLYSPTFYRDLKKLHDLQRVKLQEVIELVCASPFIGVSKSNNLEGVYIYKFRHGREEILIAYEFLASDSIRFLKFGPHENFYRDLKREK
jgi:mRNA-degrading endonuclease RelE of RelBE toxin-antitoxin system